MIKIYLVLLTQLHCSTKHFWLLDPLGLDSLTCYSLNLELQSLRGLVS